MHVQIETQRLQLRPLNPEDDLFIEKLLNTAGWLRFIGDRNVKSSSDAATYILKILNDPTTYYTVFQHKETAGPIGIVTFLYRDTQQYPDLGFAILPEYEKKGYAYEAANAYLTEILKTLKMEYVLGITLPDNNSSINLLERLGFRFEKKILKADQELSVYSRSTTR